MEFDYSELRGKIVAKFGTIKNFSKVLGITYEALSKKLNNHIGISQKEIVQWSDALGINPDEIHLYFFNL